MSEDLSREVPTYILRRPTCGHIVGCAVDDPDKPSRRETAKFLAEGVRAGLTVERVTVGFVRDSAKEQWCGSACPNSPHFKVKG